MKSVLKESQVCYTFTQLASHTKLIVKVVLATCHSSGSRQLFNEAFDVVIIDEATQALEAVSLVFYQAAAVLTYLCIRFVGFPFSKPRN